MPDRFPDPFPPPFAGAWGDDAHGLWAEFEVFSEGEAGGVVQRLRWIEPGAFLMGSPADEPERYDDEGPRHTVTLTRGFWLADSACTQALYSEAGLPTQAEWEYACRAGSHTPFSFGANISPKAVNYDGNYPYAGGEKGLYRKQTVPVKSLPPNAWGLYEMHGNVWEWCADGMRGYSDQDEVDPVGPVDARARRVVRGGSWIDHAGGARSAYRGADRPGYAGDFLGFRLCLRSIEPGQA